MINLANPSILIVEDEVIIAMGIQVSLETLGYRVAGIALRGEEALEKAANLHPDMVLMDITLRGDFDGIEAANQIRIKFDIPVIFLSAMTDPETLARAELSEPYGFISKPVSDELLGLTIYYALSKYKVVRQLRESEAQYRDFFESSQDGMVITDKEGIILQGNRAFAQLVGVDLNSLPGKSIAAFTPPEYLAQEQKLSQQVLDGGLSDVFQKEYMHASGWRVAVSLQMWVRKDALGEPDGFWAIIRDLSARKLAEDKLLRQSYLNRQLVEATQRLNNEFKLDALFGLVYNDLTRILEIGMLAISLYDRIENYLKVVAVNGSPPQTPLGYSFSRHHELMKSGETMLVIEDINQISDGPNFEFLQSLDVRSVAVVNLTNNERQIGAIYLGSVGRLRQFDEDERAFLAAYGHHVASAIDRTQFFEESRQRTMELEILSRLSANLRLAASSREMLPILIEEAFAFTGAVVGAIYIIGRGNHIIDSYQIDQFTPYLEDWFNIGESLWKTALADDQSIIHSEVVNLAKQQPGGSQGSCRIVEKVVISLRSNQYITGLLALGFSKPFSMDDGLKRVARAFAEIAGNALQRSGSMEILEQQVYDRTRELSTLYELTLLTNTPGSLEKMLKASLEKVLASSEAQAAVIFKTEKPLARLTLLAQAALPVEILQQANTIELSDETAAWLEESSTSRLAINGSQDAFNILPLSGGFSIIIYVPVRYEKVTLGLLCILWKNLKDISAENVSLIRAVAERLGSAIQNRALRLQAEQAAVLEERQRLAHDLHDSVTQSIYSMTMLSEAGMDMASRGEQEKLIACMRDLQQSSIHALREMRLLLFELRIPRDNGLNMVERLWRRFEAVERHSGIRVEFPVEGSLSLPARYQEELYLVASEALNNSLKHSGTQMVLVELHSLRDQFIMVIEDKGSGFDALQQYPGGIGIESMRERVERLGGEFKITSQAGSGTRVEVKLKV